MERWRGRVALVTGASMGMGEAICRLLVSHGMKIVACARSLDKLQKLTDELSSGPGEVFPVQCDLRKAEDIHSMFSQVKGKWGGVDVCINNAGLALDAPILEGDTEKWQNMWEVNVMALCICSCEAVRSMKDRGVDDGHIINMNSLSGHRVGKAHFYSASKYAVTSLTEGIRWELRGMKSHIRITSISPGLVKTNFAYTMLGEEGARETYNTRQSLTAEDMAKTVEFVLSTPPHVEINEVMMRPTEQVV